MLDINGKSYTLYSYLKAGKTVVIDMSATWCGPCCNYHKSGALETIWAEHGPKGQPGVNANTTDDMMVLFIEADCKTTVANLKGTGNTQGDWVTGTPYPIFNPEGAACSQVMSSVSISVVNALGQRVFNQDLGKMSAGEQVYSFDVSTLRNGLYFLNLTIGSNTITKKIAVNR